MGSEIVMKLQMNSLKILDAPKIVIQSQIAVKKEYAFNQGKKKIFFFNFLDFLKENNCELFCREYWRNCKIAYNIIKKLGGDQKIH